MKAILTAAAFVTLLVGATTAQSYKTLEILGSEALPEAEAVTGVRHPRPPVYVLLEDGRPLVSEAGYLQLAGEGPGFYYGAGAGARAGSSRASRRLGSNNWGAIEAMGLTGRIVERWRARHPDIRLGIDEISSRLGGFPDYDGDGISDHLTHQAGMNVNFLLPCRRQPEVLIHVGTGRHEELFDPGLFADLVAILVAERAYHLTTNAALGLLDDPDLRAAFAAEDREDDGYARSYRHANGHTRLYLLTPRGDHGDHVNALLWKGH